MTEIAKVTELTRIKSQKIPTVPAELDNCFPVSLTLNLYLCQLRIKKTSKKKNSILPRLNLQWVLVTMLINKAAVIAKSTTTLRRYFITFTAITLLLYSFCIAFLIKVTHYWVLIKILS